jgi:hypothetical protein
MSAPKTWMAGPSSATESSLVAQDHGLATVPIPRTALHLNRETGVPAPVT